MQLIHSLNYKELSDDNVLIELEIQKLQYLVLVLLISD